MRAISRKGSFAATMMSQIAAEWVSLRSSPDPTFTKAKLWEDSQAVPISDSHKRGRKAGAARKLSKIMFDTFDDFWQFLPCVKRVEKCRNIFDDFWCDPFSAGPFCSPRTIANGSRILFREYCFRRERETRWVLRQTRWVLRQTQWVCWHTHTQK